LRGLWFKEKPKLISQIFSNCFQNWFTSQTQVKVL